MKRSAPIPVIVAILTGTILGACTDGTSLPNPTGRASITAINAIQGSPDLSFRIEERTIGIVPYKSSSASASYDDLDYTFNFDVLFTGDDQPTRIARQHIDFVADQHYTLLASGSITAPSITVWESTERDFAEADTVFQTRFSHTNTALGAIDIYFAADGVAPVLGEQAASLNFGEISAAADFEAGDFVVTITSGGDPTAVLYQSSPSTMPARSDFIISPFDGDANDTSPIVVRALSQTGATVGFHDPLFPSTLQFLHGAREMGNTDVYDDEQLTSQILMNHDHRELTAETPIAAGTYQYLYTPAGDTATVSLDTSFSASNGLRYRIIAVGSGGTYSTINLAMNRRAIASAAKINFFNTSSNFDLTDVYIVDADTTIDGQTPIRPGLASRAGNAVQLLTPGSYDMFLTDFQGTAAIAGPLRLNVGVGDVVDIVAFDTADTAVLELLVLPNP